MAAPRKRTTRSRTTTSRGRTTAKSGRNTTSFLAMGVITGLAIAILFYAIFIRQDANLSKGSGTQYAHTPNQPHLLNPLPPKPTPEPAPASSSVTRTTEPQQQAPISVAESTARTQITPSVPSTTPTTQAKTPEPRITKTPAPTASSPVAPSTPASKQPKSSISEDPIGSLIARNEQRAAPTKNNTPTTTRQTAPSATKDNADHVGALIKTIPSSNSTTTTTTTTTNVNKTATIPVTPEKTIALSPVPTPQTPFYLQTGSYKTENEADAMRAQLLLLGHSNASVHKALVNNQTVYRVRIGPYTSSAKLNEVQKNLETAKLKLNPVH